MKFPRLSFVLAAALAALLSSAPRASAAVANGQPAPDFTLTDLDGQVRHLSDYKGKIVVLEWNNPDCPIVHKHYDSGNIPRPAEGGDGQGRRLAPDQFRGARQGGRRLFRRRIQGLARKARVQSDGLPARSLRHGRAPLRRPDDAPPLRDHRRRHAGLPRRHRQHPLGRSGGHSRAENYVQEALAAVEAGQPVAKGSSRPYGCTVKY